MKEHLFFPLLILFCLFGCNHKKNEKITSSQTPFEIEQQKILQFLSDSLYLKENYSSLLADVIYMQSQEKLVIRYPKNEEVTSFIILQKNSQSKIWNDTLVYQEYDFIVLDNAVQILNNPKISNAEFILLRTFSDKYDHFYCWGFFENGIKPIKKIEEISNLELSFFQDSIWTSYVSGGCADMNFKMYKQQYDSLFLQKQLSINLCDTHKDSCEIIIDENYHKTISSKHLYKYLKGFPTSYIDIIYSKIKNTSIHSLSTLFYEEEKPLNFLEKEWLIDSLFLKNQQKEKYEYRGFGGQIFIGNIFTKNEKHALLRYQNTDTTAVFTVLKNQGIKWDTIFYTTTESKETFANFSIDEKSIQFKDINFDGIQDVVINKMMPCCIGLPTCYAFVYCENKILEVKEFDKLSGAIIDQKTKNIYSLLSSEGSSYYIISKVNRHQLKTMKSVSIIMHYDDKSNSAKAEVIIDKQTPKFMTLEESKKYIPEIYQ